MHYKMLLGNLLLLAAPWIGEKYILKNLKITANVTCNNSYVARPDGVMRKFVSLTRGSHQHQ
jgi:hypothetical protein